MFCVLTWILDSDRANLSGLEIACIFPGLLCLWKLKQAANACFSKVAFSVAADLTNVVLRCAH